MHDITTTIKILERIQRKIRLKSSNAIAFSDKRKMKNGKANGYMLVKAYAYENVCEIIAKELESLKWRRKHLNN